MKRISLVAVLLVIIFFLTSMLLSMKSYTPAPVEIPPGLHAMQYEVVTTPAAQERGLGGRKEIADNYGMLFVFPHEDTYGFWMKDMLVPIDIIWIAEDGTLLGIEHNVSPDTYPKTFYPPSPVRYVLETRAGFTTDHGWKEGTKVLLPETGTKS